MPRLIDATPVRGPDTRPDRRESREFHQEWERGGVASHGARSSRMKSGLVLSSAVMIFSDKGKLIERHMVGRDNRGGSEKKFTLF